MSAVRPDEVSAILRKQLAGFEKEVDIYDGGTVLQIGDGVARVYGLSKVMAGELLEFPNNVFGMALNLEEDNVGAVLFGDETLVKEGDTVRRTGRIASMPVSDAMLGRVISPLGIPMDGGPEIKTDKFLPIERKALGVMQRQPVKEPLQTGIKAIDGMIPIGRGQRELIIGDRQTGKTAVAIDTIINQRGKDVICIYVAIGQKASTIAQVQATLEKYDAMSYTIIVAAGAAEPAAGRCAGGSAICRSQPYRLSQNVQVLPDRVGKGDPWSHAAIGQQGGEAGRIGGQLPYHPHHPETR